MRANGQAWRALYSDSSGDEDAARKAQPAVASSTSRQGGGAPSRQIQAEPLAKSVEVSKTVAPAHSPPRLVSERVPPTFQRAAEGLQILDPVPVVEPPPPRSPALAAQQSHPDETEGKALRVRGLLEPDSSGSEASEQRRVRRRRGTPEYHSPPTVAPSKSSSSTAVPPPAAETFPCQSAQPPPAAPAPSPLQGEGREEGLSAAASVAAGQSPVRQMAAVAAMHEAVAATTRLPAAVSPPRDQGRVRPSLATFGGLDEAHGQRWSEGPLLLPGGVELPAQIASCLRPYQRDGVRWLYERLFVETRGCLLTDDMGLGKTVQVACCLAAALFVRPSDGTEVPVLVLCPPSLLQNWARELRRWGPFEVEVLPTAPGQGRVRTLQRAAAGMVDVVIASRGLSRLGEDGGVADGLLGRNWGCVIIDEIHQAKNPKGLLHRSLVGLSSRRKLGLTGTPLQNSLSDVWALLHIVGAADGMTLSTFEARFGRPIARGQKRKATVKDLAVREDALKEFHELLQRSCLRRTKDEVALMLPGKNDRIVPCPLSDVQRAAYQNLLNSPDWQLALGKRQLCICGAGRPCMCGTGPIWRYIHQRQAEQKGLEDEWAAADDCGCRARCPPKCLSLTLIVLLQRVTSHLELLKPDPTPPKDMAEEAQQNLMGELCDIAFRGLDQNLYSQRRIANRLQLGSPDSCGKMQMLLPLLRHWRKRGQKVLVFSRGTRLLDVLEACLWQQGWSPQVLRLDGSTPHGQRQRLVDEFNTSAARGIFLISTRAGGVGLNLTAASVVVIFDPDWNPCADMQAQDRSFRIGQTRVVEVYRLLGAGTIEEQVYVRQVWKQQLAAAAIDGTRSARRLDDSSFGLASLFELHPTSILPSLMSEACTSRAAAAPQAEEMAGGVQVFSDLRLQAALNGNGDAPRGSDQAQVDQDLRLDDLCAPQSDDEGQVAGQADEQQASEDLAVLHGMFDQVDHSKVVRNDTQENNLLMDLQDQELAL